MPENYNYIPLNRSQKNKRNSDILFTLTTFMLAIPIWMLASFTLISVFMAQIARLLEIMEKAEISTKISQGVPLIGAATGGLLIGITQAISNIRQQNKATQDLNSLKLECEINIAELLTKIEADSVKTDIENYINKYITETNNAQNTKPTPALLLNKYLMIIGSLAAELGVTYKVNEIILYLLDTYKISYNMQGLMVVFAPEVIICMAFSYLLLKAEQYNLNREQELSEELNKQEKIAAQIKDIESNINLLKNDTALLLRKYGINNTIVSPETSSEVPNGNPTILNPSIQSIV